MLMKYYYMEKIEEKMLKTKKDFSLMELLFKEYLKILKVLNFFFRIAFACTSERTHETVLNDLCRFINYTKCIFSAKDEQGKRNVFLL